MGQTRGDVFRFYVNQIVDVDTQSIFLETPSREALIKLSSNSGLTRDPSAPQHLNDEHKKVISKDLELLELKSSQDALRKHLIAQYGQIRLSHGTSEYSDYRTMQCQVRAKQKQLEKAALDQMYNDFFSITLAIRSLKQIFKESLFALAHKIPRSCLSGEHWLISSLRTETRAQFQMKSYWKTASIP